jgi:hypothetical protein
MKMQGKVSWARIALTLTLPIAAPFLLASTALAERYTLRVGAGHPAGPSVYATVMRDYLVPELRRQVQEETEHELRIIEGYGGSIASVAETLEAAGATVRELSEAVRRQWAVSLKDFPNEMAREASSRGMPGAAVMRSYIAAATQAGHQWPVEYT